jgi:hypothetical protein
VTITIEAADAAAAVARKVLVAHAGSGLELSAVVEPGIAVWDTETHWGRSVVALADGGAATTVDGWCWFTAANDDVGKLVRYVRVGRGRRRDVGGGAFRHRGQSGEWASAASRGGLTRSPPLWGDDEWRGAGQVPRKSGVRDHPSKQCRALPVAVVLKTRLTDDMDINEERCAAG